MSDQKPLFVLWSKAAVAAAGPNLVDLQAKIAEEATEITSQARDWFLHSIPGESESVCYTCDGQESPECWRVFVRVGWYKPSVPDPDRPPNLERRTITFPESLKEPDNEMFAPYEDIMTR